MLLSNQNIWRKPHGGIIALSDHGKSGSLNGVREGTIIAALLVGFIARLLGQKLKFIMTEGEIA